MLPYSFEVVGNYVAKGGYDPATEFEFGLDLILDALEWFRDLRAGANGSDPGQHGADGV